MIKPFGLFLLRTSAIEASFIALGLASVRGCTKLLLHRLLDALYYILHILISGARAGREAHADLEEINFYVIGINRGTGIDRLLVHRVKMLRIFSSSSLGNAQASLALRSLVRRFHKGRASMPAASR